MCEVKVCVFSFLLFVFVVVVVCEKENETPQLIKNTGHAKYSQR